MGKLKKLVGITAGVLIAIIYTLGSIVDLLFDTGIDWLDWKLFVVLPIWLIVIIISLIIIIFSFSGSSGSTKMFGPFMENIDAYGKLLNLEEVTETELWQTKWPEIQALGRDFIEEKDTDKQIQIYKTLKQKMDTLGEELVSLSVLDSAVWMKLKMDSDDFARKVKNNNVNFFDQMYLNWLFTV
jgi:hypothetical protein